MATPAQSHLRGTVDRVVYHSAESDYVVLRVTPQQTTEQVAVVGNFGSVQPGESVSCTGTWVLHPRYGRQFEASECEIQPAQTRTGLIKYLSSGFVSGVGEKLAERIVAKFGDETLTIIEQTPDRLAEVPGIGKKKLGGIKEALRRQKGVRSALVFLQELGLGPITAAKVCRTYGPSTVGTVRENPYRLVADVSGIGFRTADHLATRLGVDPRSHFRIQAGIVHAVEEAASEGHVYLPRRQASLFASKLLQLPASEVDEQVDSLVASRRVITEDLPDLPLYVPSLHAAEVGTAMKLRAMAAARDAAQPSAARPPISPPPGERLELSQGQQQAINLALREKCLIITGGPGVGKTTTVSSLVSLFRREGLSVALCAPTGRAAKRLSQAAGAEAKTIHRMLGYNPSLNTFEHSNSNPLPADVVIVDEASMIDIVVMQSLLDAIPIRSKLILVGDVDQIPPVAPGSPLREIIASDILPVVRLTELFRQAGQSAITRSAHRINSGKMPILTNEEAGDFFFIEQEDPETIVSTILELCRERIPRRFSLEALRDVQVIVPMHRGTVGVQNLNQRLQRALNPSPVALRVGHREFRVGDKVMQMKNNYDKEVYNGDIGFVENVNRIDASITVRMDQRMIHYTAQELDDLVTAYAISVHKSQGSEYPAVIIPMTTSHFPLLQRNLLYTAVTRARQLLVLIGSKKAIAMAISNNKVAERYSRLAWRLRRQEKDDAHL